MLDTELEDNTVVKIYDDDGHNARNSSNAMRICLRPGSNAQMVTERWMLKAKAGQPYDCKIRYVMYRLLSNLRSRTLTLDSE